MLDELNFDDLVPREVLVSVAGKKYILVEASGDAACKYRNALMKATEMTDGKVSRINGMADVEPLLVSLCLLTEDRKPVLEKLVRSWQARILKKLFERVKEISDLGEADTVESLEKQQVDLQRRIDKLKEETVVNPTSDLQSGTTSGST